jgi:hypothetical protein
VDGDVPVARGDDDVAMKGGDPCRFRQVQRMGDRCRRPATIPVPCRRRRRSFGLPSRSTPTGSIPVTPLRVAKAQVRAGFQHQFPDSARLALGSPARRVRAVPPTASADRSRSFHMQAGRSLQPSSSLPIVPLAATASKPPCRRCHPVRWSHRRSMPEQDVRWGSRRGWIAVQSVS